MVNLDLIIERIEKLKGITGDKHVAAILGISPQDFSNRKKRGSLLPVIFEWAINETVNLDWLIKGDERTVVAEESPPYRKTDPVTKKINQHLEQMDEEAKRDVLKYAEEKELLRELMAERQKNRG